MWSLAVGEDEEVACGPVAAARRGSEATGQEEQLDALLESILAVEGDGGNNGTQEGWWAKHFGADSMTGVGPQIQELEEHTASRQAVAGEGVPLPAEALFARWTAERQEESEQRAGRWKSIKHTIAQGGGRRKRKEEEEEGKRKAAP